MPPERPSGAEFRKRKRDRENEDKNMSKVLISWTKDTNISENCPNSSQMDDIKTDGIVHEVCQEPEATASHYNQINEIASLNTTDSALNNFILQDESFQKAVQPNNTTVSLDRNDPESWFPLHDFIRSFFIEQGPDQGKE